MNCFLSQEELIAFTTCHSAEGQSFWLKLHEIDHTINANGSVIVARSCLDVVRPQGWRKRVFLTKVDILKSNSYPRRGVGIYFLRKKNEILYVGRTTNFFVRMAAHDKGEIDFDSVIFMEMEEAQLGIYEPEYIKRFKPKFNIIHNKSVPFSVPQRKKLESENSTY